jgi:hypothetical protein
MEAHGGCHRGNIGHDARGNMMLWNRLRSWMHATLQRPRLESEMDVELHFHMESYAEDLVRNGVARQEAMRRASIPKRRSRKFEPDR